jgi:hypothetical protein
VAISPRFHDSTLNFSDNDKRRSAAYRWPYIRTFQFDCTGSAGDLNNRYACHCSTSELTALSAYLKKEISKARLPPDVQRFTCVSYRIMNRPLLATYVFRYVRLPGTLVSVGAMRRLLRIIATVNRSSPETTTILRHKWTFWVELQIFRTDNHPLGTVFNTGTCTSRMLQQPSNASKIPWGIGGIVIMVTRKS